MSHSARDLMAGTSFCILPWVHCHVTTKGEVKACCVSPVRLGNLRHHTLVEIWNGMPARMLRRAHKSGAPVAGCERCYTDERAGARSMRQMANHHFAERAPALLEHTDARGYSTLSRPVDYNIHFSNICNFKCRSCGHAQSSRWFNDWVELVGLTEGPSAVLRAFDTTDEFWTAFDGFIEDVEKIEFVGGEPLLADEHYAILLALRARGKMDVAIHYNTNFSVTEYRGTRVTELWRDFHDVHVSASLDASGLRGDVMRHGQSWEQVLATRERYREECPGVRVSVHCTVSAMNVCSVAGFHRELIDIGFIPAEDFEVNLLHSPSHLSTQVLPAEIKRRADTEIVRHVEWLRSLADENSTRADDILAVAQHFEGVVRFMWEADRSDLVPQLRNYSRKLDGMRGEDSSAAFPELAAILT